MAYHLVIVVPQIGGWRAHLPDFPGCRADAPRLESAISRAMWNAQQSRNGPNAKGWETPIARTYAQIRGDAAWASERNVQMRSAVICWVNLCG